MKRKLAFLGAILLAAFIFTYEGNTYQTHALDEEDQAWIEEARGALQNIVEDREVMALVYLWDDLTIRAEAAEDSTKVVTVPSGQMVEWLLLLLFTGLQKDMGLCGTRSVPDYIILEQLIRK